MDTPDQRCPKGRFRVRSQGKEIVHALVTGIYVIPVGLLDVCPVVHAPFFCTGRSLLPLKRSLASAVLCHHVVPAWLPNL